MRTSANIIAYTIMKHDTCCGGTFFLRHFAWKVHDKSEIN